MSNTGTFVNSLPLPKEVTDQIKDLNRYYQLGSEPGSNRTPAQIEADKKEAFKQLGEIMRQYPGHTDQIIDLFSGPSGAW